MNIDLNQLNKSKWKIFQKKFTNKIKFQKKISKLHLKMKNVNKNQSIWKNIKKNNYKIKQYKEMFQLKKYNLEK